MRKGLLLDALVVWKMASGSSSDGTSRLQIHVSSTTHWTDSPQGGIAVCSLFSRCFADSEIAE